LCLRKLTKVRLENRFQTGWRKPFCSSEANAGKSRDALKPPNCIIRLATGAASRIPSPQDFVGQLPLEIVQTLTTAKGVSKIPIPDETKFSPALMARFHDANSRSK